MQITKIIVVPLIALLLTVLGLVAKPWTSNKGHGEISMSFGSLSASSFFNNDGNRKSGFNDSLAQSMYTFDFSATKLAIHGEYGISDQLTVFGEVPIAFYSLLEKYVTDSLGNRPIRAQLQRTLIQTFAIGCDYQFISRNLIAKFRSEFRVSPYRGIPQDSSQEFLGGSSNEAILGLHFKVPFEKSWIGLNGSLSIKEQGWNNMMYLHAESGFSSVENTALTFFVDVFQPMGAGRDIPEFDIRKFQPAEFYIVPGASFLIEIDNAMIIKADYSLRVLGSTTWALGSVGLSAGYRF